MGTTNDNQDITSEAPKLLLCSSIASASDPGSNAVTKPQAGIGKEHPELSWYYMYLPYKELRIRPSQPAMTMNLRIAPLFTASTTLSASCNT